MVKGDNDAEEHSNLQGQGRSAGKENKIWRAEVKKRYISRTGTQSMSKSSGSGDCLTGEETSMPCMWIARDDVPRRCLKSTARFVWITADKQHAFCETGKRLPALSCDATSDDTDDTVEASRVRAPPVVYGRSCQKFHGELQLEEKMCSMSSLVSPQRPDGPNFTLGTSHKRLAPPSEVRLKTSSSQWGWLLGSKIAYSTPQLMKTSNSGSHL